MAPELVVALDVPALEEARRLVALLRPTVRWFKVGMELFTAAGPAAVEAIRTEGGAVLLDLKLHDIPHTVSSAVRSAARLEAEMLTLHLAGGAAMIRAAVDAARDAGSGLRLVGITRLTSEPAASAEFAWSVAEAALGAAALGLDGIVVSVHEAAAVRAACRPGFLIMAPGIRPAGAPADDQARVATPAEAARSGCDFIVVGRPVIRAFDPLQAAVAITREMAALAAPV